MDEKTKGGAAGQEPSGQGRQNTGGEAYDKGKFYPAYEKDKPGQSTSQETGGEDKGHDEAGHAAKTTGGRQA